MTNRNNPSSASPIHVVVLVCIVATLSYLAARLGGTLVLRPEMIWPVWPGCAFLVAVLLLTPRKIWPVLLLAGLSGFALYDAREHLTIRATSFLLAADLIEILVAALGVSYVFGGVPRLTNVKSLAMYSLFAVILAPVAVASAAALALEGDSWWVGFFTEALALLTVTPAILSWADFARTPVKRPNVRYVEAVFMFVGLAIVAYLTLVASTSESRPALIYSLVPFLLWAALRFGIAGTSNSMLLVAFVAIVGVIHRRGPFTGHMPLTDVLSLQLFLLVAGASFMVLAAVVEQDNAAEQALGASEERLRLAAQVGRMFAYSWDVATDVTERSGESAEILGVRNGESPKGAAITSMVHPDDKEALEIALAKVSVESPTVRITYRIVRPDGVVIWLERNSRAYFDLAGNPTRMVGMVADVTERKRAEEALAGLTRKLIEAQEQERSRIGRELHDDINQRLALLAVELGQWSKNESRANLSGHLSDALTRIMEISTDVQALSHRLHSSKLEYLGLAVAARSFCKELSDQAKVEVQFSHSAVPSTLPKEVSLCLFRVLQEALQNAVKYSSVRTFRVDLHGTSHSIELVVSDDGKGFDEEEALSHYGLGLISMRERMQMVHGMLNVKTGPGVGTTISARVPLQMAELRAKAG